MYAVICLHVLATAYTEATEGGPTEGGDDRAKASHSLFNTVFLSGHVIPPSTNPKLLSPAKFITWLLLSTFQRIEWLEDWRGI
jgi:hypothetical protein